MSQTYRFLKECGVFYLLTLNGGKPAGRPFGAVTEADGDLFVSTSAGKDVYRQMKENERVQIVALKYGSRDWIRVDGIAEECGDPDKKELLLQDCPNLRRHFNSADDPAFLCFRIRVTDSVLYTDSGADILKRSGKA